MSQQILSYAISSFCPTSADGLQHLERDGCEQLNVFSFWWTLPLFFGCWLLRKEPWLTSTLKVFERRGDLQEWGRQLSAAISLVDESRESQTLCKFLLDVVWASRW